MKISSIIKEYKKINCGDVVITGGEPTMYPEDLEKLCKKLREANEKIFITIESNGTYIGNFVRYVNLMSISPKLKSSVPYDSAFEKMHERSRINFESFKQYNKLKEKKKIDIQWKFVFTGMDDIEEIKTLQKKIGFRNEDVYLMPEGITKSDLDQKREDVVNACMKTGFNYTDRIHILIWGNKRGT